LSENILLVTFNTDPWHISVAFEILAQEVKNKNRVEWLILDKHHSESQELPISSKLRSAEIRRKLKKILLENKNLANKVKICYSLPTPNQILDYDSRSKEVAYAELISRLRDSNPCILHNYDNFLKYQETYKLVRNAFREKLNETIFSKIYLFNGRPLRERAVSDACLVSRNRISYFETFNENWKDRYFIFNEPTHSPKYRSDVMRKFAIQARIFDKKLFENRAIKWFEDRRLGRTQSYTKNQKKLELAEYKKPYYIFFHSSQDELDMVGLTNRIWGNQFNTLKILVEIFEKQKKFNLVLRIHPHLFYKSKNEQKLWKKFGMDLEEKYPWFRYIPSDSPINSYKLIESAVGVITSGSTVGVEAAYLGKQSILLGEAFHKFMGITVNPATKKDLVNLFRREAGKSAIEKSFRASLDYGYFNEVGGLKFAVTKYDQVKREYSFGAINISLVWYVALVRKIEQILVRIMTRHKLRRCTNDCGFNSSQRWK
jgi:hypothetical protein